MTDDEMKIINEIRQEMAEKEFRKQKEEIIDEQIKIASALYDKAITYTNIILMAGYAGFFGLWSLTKDKLTTKQVFWSALCMIISLCVFVFFEVGKMIFNACFMLSRNYTIKKLPNAKTLEEMRNILNEYNKITKSRSVKFVIFWIIADIIIIPAAFLGASILMYSFIVNLLTLYKS